MAKEKLKTPEDHSKSHIIDKCETCGFVSYSVIARCPVCGNMILTGEKILKRDWTRGRVKEILNEKKKNGEK